MQTKGVYKVVIAVSNFDHARQLRSLGTEWIEDRNALRLITMSGAQVEFVLDVNSGLKEVHWSADFDKTFVDSGVKHVFSTSYSFKEVIALEEPTNSYSRKMRVNREVNTTPSAPVGISHIAIFSANYLETVELFKSIGFIVSDSIKGRCVFLRSKEENTHHQILVSNSAEKKGLHHLSFAMKDIYAVFSKGIELESLGWKTLLGPGRHAISSSTHWYFETDAGSFEITSDEDYVDSRWVAREFDPATSIVYEWVIEGGIDPNTRRQKGAAATKFVEQRMK